MAAQTLKKLRNLLVYLIALSLLPGCQSANTPMYVVQDYSPASIRGSVFPGDYVEVATTEGENYAFEVTAINDNSLIGAGIVINYQDIEKLEVRRTSTTNTIDAGEIVGAVLLLVIGIALIAAGSSNSAEWGGLFR